MCTNVVSGPGLWFQVNDPKSLNALIDVVREEAEASSSLLTKA